MLIPPNSPSPVARLARCVDQENISEFAVCSDIPRVALMQQFWKIITKH
jgi:hypothetical protein